MATLLRRLEFKQRYPEIRQGLFIVPSEKRLPKGQEDINIGRVLSAALSDVTENDRADAVSPLIADAVSRFTAMTLTHIEILFTPELHLDVVGTLLALCRNRKICIVWPGVMDGGKLYYAKPEDPEYYECDPRPLQDTYIIFE
ncbi:MAG: BREX-3 system P-loop-containing protein BrxF [Clostridiales bacterium]|nr:BREX-3 system P-loop-containing protein BrxF [Clostridiales bacterium]